MCFGSVFVTSLIIVVIVAFNSGWLAALDYIGAYLLIWIGVGILGGLLIKKEKQDPQNNSLK